MRTLWIGRFGPPPSYYFFATRANETSTPRRNYSRTPTFVQANLVLTFSLSLISSSMSTSAISLLLAILRIYHITVFHYGNLFESFGFVFWVFRYLNRENCYLIQVLIYTASNFSSIKISKTITPVFSSPRNYLSNPMSPYQMPQRCCFFVW